MPFFLSRPFFLRRGGRGRGEQQQVVRRATGSDAPTDAPPPSPSLYVDLRVISPGAASPLGPSKAESDGAVGVNFALWSSSASRVSLCLLDPKTRRPAREIPLSRTDSDGNVWAATVVGLPLKGVGYAYKVDGPPPPNTRSRWSPEALLLDPYAPLVDSRSHFGVREAREAFVPLVGSSFVGTFDFEARDFDWGESFFRFFFPLILVFDSTHFPFLSRFRLGFFPSIDQPPGDDANAKHAKTPPGKHVIYEVGVRPFTAAGGFPSRGKGGRDDDDPLRGTFAGLAARAPYLASLGVTAVELLPIFEYDELEFRCGLQFCFARSFFF